jgi:hypothetical protein
LNAACEG